MTPGKPFLIGLTGSIGMGKSTTADMFRELGIPVWDADAAVRRLYQPKGAAVAGIAQIYPDAVVDGQVDRNILKDWIADDETALSQIESVVHPLVAQDRTEFIQHQDAPIVVLDIPLLFEKGTDQDLDLVLVVSVKPEEQRTRVMARPGMTEAMFQTILGKQMPDHEKRSRADVVIETETMDGARKAVETLMAKLRNQLAHA